MFTKGSVSHFFSKDLGSKLIGGAKGLARVLDEPVVQSGISAAHPELGAALGVAKRSGFLEKVKNA